MRTLWKLVVIVSVLFLELVFLQIGSELVFGIGHGQIVDTPYRQKERVVAFSDYLNHRSPETTARFQQELRLMHKHEDWKMYLTIGLFFAINGVWIYHFIRYGFKKTPALERFKA